MGRSPCCSKVGLQKGPWTAKEDQLLKNYIKSHGEGHWSSLPNKAGLLRCGKSCRLRWMNYLRPDIKRGDITPDEDDIIIRMHSLLGNRWSLIAGRLPGRTDNEIKNYWNTHLSKKIKEQAIDPANHTELPYSLNFPYFKDGKGNKPNMRKRCEGENVGVLLKPKPIRFTYPVSGHFKKLGGQNCKFAEVGWSDDNYVSVNCIGRDRYQEKKPINLTSDEMSLEKVYTEYLQLLNSDENVDRAQQLDS